MFKAQGPVWHQSDRRQGRVPESLRHLDMDASWRKSGYHGWVYGYGLHLTCNLAGFSKLVQVETGSVAEATVLEAKTRDILLIQTQEIGQSHALSSSAHQGLLRRFLPTLPPPIVSPILLVVCPIWRQT